MALYDISPLVDPKIAVWPGDSAFVSKDLLRIEEGSSVYLSTITLSCHTGAHADAPCHYTLDGPGIADVPLERFIGPCLLVDVQPKYDAILPNDLEGIDLDGAERLLFRTRATNDRTEFPDPFASLTPELVHHVADSGVVLIGLDTPSVDRFDSKDLPSHKALFERGVANLENLDLTGVPAGRYELIALPLRLLGRDASPVRAILRDL